MATKQVDPAFPGLRSPPRPQSRGNHADRVAQSTGAASSRHGTDLLYVSNSHQAIFYYLDAASYYVLISGRWFKARRFTGRGVRRSLMPLKIPPDSPSQRPALGAGTPQAQEALSPAPFANGDLSQGKVDW
jgi:hypothetical protein